ncbi:DUF433 domain-containing protein [Haloflavibacter putidus]|uniref:DUF433 domain-containing protein n=1 Tax=Haloflavibacter putidus TaxID=2576776 RepID=A0A507ZQM6_9FLAO|nr:DUF433 domain-containing protein [Haloflavibacter putidus]TQD38833.1 DUF433 domain-containing protein [Haloflavibacter putidus]
MNFENKPKIGIGSYTAAEIAHILGVSYSKVFNWMNIYWDKQLGDTYGDKYSWVTEGKRAVSFHTFVEFYVMMRFSEAGVKPKEVLKAHKELSEKFKTPFPFALKPVLESIKTDKKHIYFEIEGATMTLDGSKQLNLELIKLFFVKLDFNSDDLASRYYPLGKDKSILIDPERKFGQPVFADKNIQPQILLEHYKAGDPIPYLASIYDIEESYVKDAIEFCTKNAA